MLESLYEEYQSVGDGLLVVEMMGQNFNGSNNVTVANLQSWIAYIQNTYGSLMTFYVTADPGFAISYHYNPTDFYIPYYWMIDQNKVIYWKSLNVDTFESRIQTLLTE